MHKYQHYIERLMLKRLFVCHENGLLTDRPLRESQQPWAIVRRVFVVRSDGTATIYRRPQ